MYAAQGSKREVFKFLYGFDENWQKPESLTLRFQKKVSIMGLDPSRGLPWPGEGLERIDHARSGGAWGGRVSVALRSERPGGAWVVGVKVRFVTLTVRLSKIMHVNFACHRFEIRTDLSNPCGRAERNGRSVCS